MPQGVANMLQGAARSAGPTILPLQLRPKDQPPGIATPLNTFT